MMIRGGGDPTPGFSPDPVDCIYEGDAQAAYWPVD
jgi:hypothetical protein